MKTALVDISADVDAKLAALELSWEEKQGVTRNDAALSQTIVDALF